MFSLLKGMGQRAFDTSEKMHNNNISHLSVTLQQVSADNASYYYLTQDTPYQLKNSGSVNSFNVKNMRR